MAVEPRPVTGGLRLHVVEPDAAWPDDVEVRRLFRRRRLTRGRRARLRALPKVLVTHEEHVVGLAAFERWTDDLRVHEIACAPDLGFTSIEIVVQLLDCLELAAIAGGARRMVLLPWALPGGLCLDRLGYTSVGLGGRELGKTLL